MGNELEKAKKLEENYSRVEKTAHLKSLKPFFKYNYLIKVSKELNHSSKQMLIALSVAFEGIFEGDSTASLFSKDFEKILDGITGLAAQINGLHEGERLLIKNVFLMLLMDGMGLFSLTIENRHKPISPYPDYAFRALLATDTIEVFCRALADVTGSGKNTQTLYELCVLLYFTFAFSNESEDSDGDFMEAVRDKVSSLLDQLEITIDEACQTEKMSIETASEIKPYVSFLKEAIYLKNFNPFIQKIKEVLKTNGINFARLERDIMEMKKTSLMLQAEFSSKSAEVQNVVSFIG